MNILSIAIITELADDSSRDKVRNAHYFNGVKSYLVACKQDEIIQVLFTIEKSTWFHVIKIWPPRKISSV